VFYIYLLFNTDAAKLEYEETCPSFDDKFAEFTLRIKFKSSRVYKCTVAECVAVLLKRNNAAT
jgi:hypothetical protein